MPDAPTWQTSLNGHNARTSRPCPTRGHQPRLRCSARISGPAWGHSKRAHQRRL